MDSFLRCESNDDKFSVFVGFDGFKDKILRAVKTRSESQTDSKTAYFNSIKEFTDYLYMKQGKSFSIKTETITQKIGGNGILTGNALARLGVNVKCAGTFGYPKISDVFSIVDKNCKLHSFSNYGVCNAFEFGDGKIMFFEDEGLTIGFNDIANRLGENFLINEIENSDAVCFLNWSEMINSNDIWNGMLKNILPKCEFKDKKIMLIDISDCSARSENDVKCLVEIITGFKKYFKVVMSINENEFRQLSIKLNISNTGLKDSDLINKLKNCLNIDMLVLHLKEKSIAYQDNNIVEVAKELIPNPKIITGGGDNFNAGLLFGLMNGFEIEKNLDFANQVALYYIKNGASPVLSEL